MREMRQNEDEKVKEEMKDNMDKPVDSNDGVKTGTNIVDFRNLKATDLKNNKRIIIPALDEDGVSLQKKLFEK